ncbi:MULTISPECIES: zinc-dependent metalloprotease [Bacteroides]|uniref:zinc-dependent metalloprotease n=1 Tax=Bacteroides TaxID=816 RepID=UPI00189D88B8|nr:MULTISPECIES: zinc-dependent metalloprotease [Bacteroides]MDC2612894.1 zinc-dependent metalloprotease [Bacteroides ovatus]MDC2631957.1 zinc-dependent metalloprotease [Bacteroides ovatus]
MLKGIIGAIFLAVVCTCLYGQQPDIAAFFKEGASVEVIPGMFTTYRSNGRIYWEVPDSLIGREFVVTTTILAAPARPDRDMEKKFGYSGDMIGPVFFSFRKHGNELWMLDPQHERVIEDPEGVYAKIAARRGNERLYKILPVKAKNPESNLVEIGEVLKDFPLFTLDIVSFDLLIGTRLREKDCIKEIKGFDNRLLIHATRTYQSSSMGMRGKPVAPPYIGDWDTGICIKLLSKEPLDPVFANTEAYFVIDKNYFQGDQPADRKAVIKRWRLEIRPEDEEKYMKGELVEPIQPIIFYIDRNTPEKYIGCIIEAVRDWRPAFEKAGFKNAIDARLVPTVEEDSDFSIYDSSYPFISWKISGQNNAYGPTPCEPRSGEIIACHIGIFSSVLNLEQKWYFAQCGANDPQAWNIELPDSLQYEQIKKVLTHEVGHTLGLKHNFLGSSHYSIDQLRDNDFLSRYSIGSSIMDYVRCNYALRPQDKVDLTNRWVRVGEYDKWAIEWGYRIFPGKNVAEREKNRDLWNQEKQKDSSLHFSGGVDVRAQAEDLGNDHVVVNAQGIENLKYLCEHPDAWKVTDKTSLRVLQGRYEAVLNHYKQWVRHVLSHLGGKRLAETEDENIYIPEKAAYNQKVMNFIQTYVLQPPVWMFDKTLTTNLEIDGSREFDRFYEELMSEIIRSLQKVGETENACEDMLSVDDFLESIHNGLFTEWDDNVFVSDARYKVQLLYVNKLSKLLDRSEKVTSSRLLVSIMQTLNRMKEEGLDYSHRITDPVAKKRAMFLVDSI